jgi:hypothetical protein
VRTFKHLAFEAPFTTQYLGPKGLPGSAHSGLDPRVVFR